MYPGKLQGRTNQCITQDIGLVDLRTNLSSKELRYSLMTVVNIFYFFDLIFFR